MPISRHRRKIEKVVRRSFSHLAKKRRAYKRRKKKFEQERINKFQFFREI